MLLSGVETGVEVGLDNSALSLSKRQTRILNGTTNCETQSTGKHARQNLFNQSIPQFAWSSEEYQDGSDLFSLCWFGRS
jgi:hypothetical protein